MKLLLISLCLLMPRVVTAETVTIANGEWPPYMSQALKHYGLASHIVSLAFERQGIDVKYVFLPRSRNFDNTKHGLYDGTVMWSKVPEREEYFIYSASIIEGQNVFFHLKTYPKNWLDPKKVGHIRLGLISGFAFTNYLGVGSVETVGSARQNFGKLLRDRIDIYLAEREVGYFTLRDEFSAEQVAAITHSSNDSPPAWYYLMLNRERHKKSGLMVRFNRGLQQIRAEGVYKQLIHDLEDGAYNSPKD